MNKQTIYDATIEFHGGGSAVISELTEKQFHQLHEMLKLIEHKAPYYVTGTTADRPGFGVRLNDLWRRVKGWMEGR